MLMGEYQFNCFFTSTTQCKKIKRKIAVDIEINIQEGVPAILLMIKYFLRKRPNNNDNSPANDKNPYKILENKEKSSIFCSCLCLALCSGHATVPRDLKNFLQVFRNMPDTLLKFGGIWLGRWSRVYKIYFEFSRFLLFSWIFKEFKAVF